MRRFGFLAATLAAFAVGAAPMAAEAAAAAARGRPAAPGQITPQQREQGNKEAPGAIALAKIACTPNDAMYVASGTNAQRQKINFYEVSCDEGLGYVLEAGPESAIAFNCLGINADAEAQVAAGKQPSLTCRLPNNLDAKQGLVPILTKAGRSCTVANARAMGATPTGEIYLEAACNGGTGYVIKTAAPGSGAANEVMDCAEFLGTQSECQLTTKPQIVAAIAQLAVQNGSACATPTDARYMGAGSTSAYYEIACGTGNQGFVIQTAKAGGKVEAVIECSKAQAVGAGCKLTDATVAEEAEAATYTQLAQSAGYPCQVSKYRFIGIDQNSKSEVVELACSNRQDGAIGLFPTAAGAKGRVVDCVVGGSLGVSCNLSQPSAVYAKYSQGLASMGKTQCQVNNAKWLGATNDGFDLIETACSDGLPGFVMTVAKADGKVRELLTCGQARQAGAPCTFPTNTAGAPAAAAAPARR
jgi:hypothetical protein